LGLNPPLACSNGGNRKPVMPGFMSGIHAFFCGEAKTWMAGTSPAMTAKK
jgi:hypothetical protein